MPDTSPAALGPDAKLALAFLDAMGARRLEEATAMTAPGFVMVFPGGKVFTDWPALLAWAAPRYRRIEKVIERVEEAPGAVYVSGTLQGERPDGAPFAGVRFIDRFEVAGGQILRQEVWNDLGELGIA
jgi:hypothetical protein